MTKKFSCLYNIAQVVIVNQKLRFWKCGQKLGLIQKGQVCTKQKKQKKHFFRFNLHFYRGVISLIWFHFSSSLTFLKYGYRLSSRTKIFNSVSSNQFISTSKTHFIKKCPISRANIVNFDTFTLYQNVSYKMSLKYQHDTNMIPFFKQKSLFFMAYEECATSVFITVSTHFIFIVKESIN